MARILQVRRGSTSQNNIFTGMPGEISFDTDAKTLRVHDGTTVGGYTLARLDQVIGDDGFDINSIPDEFWQEKMAKFAPPALEELTSRLVPVLNTSYIQYTFLSTMKPKFVTVVLVCQTPAAGYSIGEEVAAFGIDTRTSPSPFVFTDDTTVNVRLMVGGGQFWVSHRDTGVTTPINNAEWNIKFRVYG